jgi:hypothetical protein
LVDPGVDGRIILKWIFRKYDVGMNWIDLAQPAGSFECGNKLSCSIRCRVLLDELRTC